MWFILPLWWTCYCYSQVWMGNEWCYTNLQQKPLITPRRTVLTTSLSFASFSFKPSILCALGGWPKQGTQAASWHYSWHHCPLPFVPQQEGACCLLLPTKKAQHCRHWSGKSLSVLCSLKCQLQSIRKGSWHPLTAKMNQPDSKPARWESRFTIRREMHGKFQPTVRVTYLQFGIRGID